MRLNKRLTALDTNAGKYSHRKVPIWKIGLSDITNYIESLFEEIEEPAPSF